MSGGSLQLRLYRRARRDGATLEEACAASGIDTGEAKIHDANDAKNQPPPEAYELIGHNRKDETMEQNVAGEELRQLVERAERLIEERKGIQDDIKDVFAEAKARGFDAPAMREVIRLRAIDRQKREEKAAMVQLYGEQLGLF